MLRNDHFVFWESGEIRDPHVKIRIASGDARGGRMGEARGASRRYQAPFRAGQFGVEIVTSAGAHHVVPVTAGIFAGGRVQVSGPGISAGEKVVVSQ